MTIRVMTIEDYDAVYALWASLPGIGLHEEEDSRERMAYYLRRNPESCFVAKKNGAVIGAVLCGNDGRRGYINHLAVAAERQGQGIGRALMDACLDALRREGIRKCAFTVFGGNEEGNAFWRAMGARRWEDGWYHTLDVN